MTLRSDTLYFELIDLPHRSLFEKWSEEATPISSVHNFSALYSWRWAYHLQAAEEKGWLFLRRSDPPIGYLPPLCKEEDTLEALGILQEFCQKEGHALSFIEAEPWFLERLDRLGVTYQAQADEDNAEYVYDGEKLRTLSGKKMHNKKNHYNKFVKNNIYEIKPIRKSMDAALEMNRRWLKEKGTPDTDAEYRGVQELFAHEDQLPFTGSAVFLDGRCEAFTISEDVANDGVIVHVEKANDAINGLFTFINSENQKINHPKALKVNREQDLGIPGLRKAKLSWRPIEMIEKYRLTNLTLPQ